MFRVTTANEAVCEGYFGANTSFYVVERRRICVVSIGWFDGAVNTHNCDHEIVQE